MRGAPLQTREEEESGRDAEIARAEVEAVAAAISAAWIRFGDVPFPLYDEELDKLARAAIHALRRNDRVQRSFERRHGK